MKKLLLILALMGATMVGGWSHADATKYKKVTAMTDLGDGDVVVLAYETGKKVSGGISGTSKYIEKVDAEVADGYASAVTTEITLGQSGDAWTLTLSGKLVGATGSSNDLTFGKTTNSTWSISIEGGDAVIKNVDASEYVIRYNASSSRFSAYKGTVQPIQLYKKVAGSDPVIGLSANALSFTKKKLVEGKASDSQELTVTTADLATEKLTVAMAKGEVFSVTPGVLESIGGNVTVSYEATAEGEYKDTVVVTGKDNEGNAIVKKCAVSVVIEAADPVGSNATYNVLQDLSKLNSGDKVFIGAKEKDLVMGLYDSGSNIKGVEAVYSSDRHKVTVSDVYAYTVEISDGVYTFKDVKGKYLSNTSVSSSKLTTVETVNNKAQWTLSITDDVATIKSVGGVSGREYLRFNSANSLFSCYGSTSQQNVYIYSSNAPEYQEKVLEPELNVLVGGETAGETLDWGEVVYDDSWGTEAAPYSQMMEINIVGKDLSENVTLALTKGTDFQIYTTSITPKDGSVNSKVSINFEVNKEGEYSDVLTITCGTMTKTLNLKAKAVKEASDDPSSKPQITTDKVRVYLNPYFYNPSGYVEEMDIFYVSAKNLKKNVYIKWLNSDGFTIPTGGKGEMSVSVAGYGDVPFGSAVSLGNTDFEKLEVTVYVNAYYVASYYSQLLFYTVSEEDKDANAAEHIVELVVEMSTYETPDPDPTHDPNTNPSTGVQSTRVVKNGQAYNLLGQPVGMGYQGIVIVDGEKKIW